MTIVVMFYFCCVQKTHVLILLPVLLLQEIYISIFQTEDIQHILSFDRYVRSNLCGCLNRLLQPHSAPYIEKTTTQTRLCSLANLLCWISDIYRVYGTVELQTVSSSHLFHVPLIFQPGTSFLWGVSAPHIYLTCRNVFI